MKRKEKLVVNRHVTKRELRLFVLAKNQSSNLVKIANPVNMVSLVTLGVIKLFI